MSSLRHSRGTVLVWTAITFPVLLLFVGLAIDAAYISIVSGQLQTVADAAALAGAVELAHGSDHVTQKAMEIASANHVLAQSMAIDSSDIVLGRFNRSSEPLPGFHAGARPYNAARITVRKTTGSPAGPLPLTFGPLIGLNHVNISRQSIAMLPLPPRGVIVLDPSGAAALHATGSGDFSVLAGGIIVNSSNVSAVVVTGSGAITADFLNIVGGYSAHGLSKLPTVEVNVDPASDPYESLPAPEKPAPGALNSTTFTPGYFPNGIKISSNNAFTFQPGLYYLDNGLDITGSGAVTANNVLFYIKSGALHVSASAAVSFSPQVSGPFRGITIFQPAANDTEARITGSSDLNITGAIYIPGARLTLTGSGPSFGNVIVVKDLTLTGSGLVAVPPSAATESLPYLVQ